MNIEDGGADKDLVEAGEYSDLADVGADRKGSGADKTLLWGVRTWTLLLESPIKDCRFGSEYGPCFWSFRLKTADSGADMDLAHAGANKKLV
jgi:hypothetical protein